MAACAAARRRGAPAGRRGRRPAATAVRRPALPLVGRDGAARARPRRARRPGRRDGRVVAIRGEAGIGKTRLVEAAAARRPGGGRHGPARPPRSPPSGRSPTGSSSTCSATPWRNPTPPPGSAALRPATRAELARLLPAIDPERPPVRGGWGRRPGRTPGSWRPWWTAWPPPWPARPGHAVGRRRPVARRRLARGLDVLAAAAARPPAVARPHLAAGRPRRRRRGVRGPRPRRRARPTSSWAGSTGRRWRPRGGGRPARRRRRRLRRAAARRVGGAAAVRRGGARGPGADLRRLPGGRRGGPPGAARRRRRDDGPGARRGVGHRPVVRPRDAPPRERPVRGRGRRRDRRRRSDAGWSARPATASTSSTARSATSPTTATSLTRRRLLHRRVAEALRLDLGGSGRDDLARLVLIADPRARRRPRRGGGGGPPAGRRAGGGDVREPRRARPVRGGPRARRRGSGRRSTRRSAGCGRASATTPARWRRSRPRRPGADRRTCRASSGRSRGPTSGAATSPRPRHHLDAAAAGTDDPALGARVAVDRSVLARRAGDRPRPPRRPPGPRSDAAEAAGDAVTLGAARRMLGLAALDAGRSAARRSPTCGSPWRRPRDDPDPTARSRRWSAWRWPRGRPATWTRRWRTGRGGRGLPADRRPPPRGGGGEPPRRPPPPRGPRRRGDGPPAPRRGGVRGARRRPGGPGPGIWMLSAS